MIAKVTTEITLHKKWSFKLHILCSVMRVTLVLSFPLFYWQGCQYFIVNKGIVCKFRF